MTLCIALQPIVYGATKDKLAHEVLVRWHDGEKNLSPTDLQAKVDWAEVDKQIISLIIENQEALADVVSRLFINLSPATASAPSAWSFWLSRLQLLTLQARFSIAVEISENMSDEVLSRIWNSLKRLPIKLAIDDYGRGYSTRSRLVQLDWDYCKFEASSLNQEDTLFGLKFCQHSGIMPIIERVEHAINQYKFMTMGLHWQQGFHHGRPQLLANYLKSQIEGTQ